MLRLRFNTCDMIIYTIKEYYWRSNIEEKEYREVEKKESIRTLWEKNILICSADKVIQFQTKANTV